MHNVEVTNVGSDGKVKWKETVHNEITTVGFNKLLDVMFGAVTAISAWFCGLVNNSGFVGFAVGDTMASHAGWTEFTDYTGERQEWTVGTAAAASITNAAAMAFPITGTGTLKGIMITSEEDNSLSTGTLWSTAAFSSAQAVGSGDTVNVTYTVTASEV
jgi:hypothetical protein